MNLGVYELKVSNIPIWWFIREQFYFKLFNFLEHKKGNKEFSQNDGSSFKRVIAHNYKRALVVLLRSLIGGISAIVNQI